MSFCVAVDDSGNALTDVNGSWSKPATVVGPSYGFAGVSCPTTTFCMAVDSDGAALSYNGSRWSSPHTISGQLQFTSVSCPTVSFCVAAATTSPFSKATPAAYVATYRSGS